MGRATTLLIGSLAVLLTSARTAQAVPIVYSTSGQIRLGNGLYEDFQGSFVLSDPVITLWDASDSRGDQRDWYTVSDFSLSSASYSLTGQGVLVVWWSLFRNQGVRVNPIDSAVTFQTPIGAVETDWNSFPRWEGDPGTQPRLFSDLTERIGGLGSGVGHVRNMRAESTGRVARIPEPSALLLYGMGIAGFALLKRRVKP